MIEKSNHINYLALVRHGESEYNAQGLWTGWVDSPLTDIGKEQARLAAATLAQIKFDAAFISNLVRARQTYDEISKELRLKKLPVYKRKALREINHGIYTGKNKQQIREMIGSDELFKLRSDIDARIPEGESGRDVYKRVVRCYRRDVLSRLMEGNNILIVGHGFSHRILAMYIEKLLPEEFRKLEFANGEVWTYLIKTNTGEVVAKLVR